MIGRSGAMRVTVNGSPREIATASPTVADLLRAAGLEGKRIAVERNGEIVPKSRYGDTALADGDRLEIVGAVGGG
jgi:sulfur carrier protein